MEIKANSHKNKIPWNQRYSFGCCFIFDTVVVGGGGIKMSKNGGGMCYSSSNTQMGCGVLKKDPKFQN